MSNNFQKIYQAAIDQNPALLPTGSYCIDECAKGKCEYSAISRCAEENNRNAVEWLLGHGAQIKYAGYGAAIGGHQDYAEELLKRGADITWVAEGAAQHGDIPFVEALLKRGAKIYWVARGAALGGHQTYAEELLNRGAKIYWVARGATLGGHQTYAEELLNRGVHIHSVAGGAALHGDIPFVEALLKRGANIDLVARCAALGGHQTYAEELLNRGANINFVAEGAATGGHQAYVEELLARGADIDYLVFTATRSDFLYTPGSKLAYLPYFKPDQLDQALKQYCDSTKLRPEVLKRIRCMSRYMHVQGFTHAEALARTDKSLYYLLLLSSMHKTHRGNLKKIPWFLMLRISSFLMPRPSSPSQQTAYQWRLQASQGLMMQCLTQYQQSVRSFFFARHKERAASFKRALEQASNHEEVVSLVNNQFSLLSGDNPYPQDEQKEKYQTSTTARGPDGFFKIVLNCHKRLNGAVDRRSVRDQGQLFGRKHV